MRPMYAWLVALLLVVCGISLGTGCAASAAREEEESEQGGTDELNLGEVEGAASTWGDATKCKPIPVVEVLKSPEIVISLDGLTLHLRDRAGTYDRVFPIGPGGIENGKSLTPTGTFYTASNPVETTDAVWGYNYPCRIWWFDSDTKKKSPVFAGLPWIRLAGPPTAGYGIHGPIDQFTAPNGGSLRRGYVSHGCIRMAATDIVEVYGRIRGKSRVPVRIQQAVERAADGDAIDVPARWIGSECLSNADCNFEGGICRLPTNIASGTVGTCTRACTRGCPDRVGEGPTFCVKDPATSAGICVPQASTTFNDQCDRYAGRIARAASIGRPDNSARADVCMPLR